MTVKLVVQEWVITLPLKEVVWKNHPAFNNLREKLYPPGTSNEEYVISLIRTLERFNARITKEFADQVVFEFDSEEDLMKFLLTWS